jgi:hypothetical protein
MQFPLFAVFFYTFDLLKQIPTNKKKLAAIGAVGAIIFWS